MHEFPSEISQGESGVPEPAFLFSPDDLCLSYLQMLKWGKKKEQHFRFSSGRGVVYVTLGRQAMFIRAFPPVLVLTGSWSEGKIIIIIMNTFRILSTVRTRKCYHP